MTKQNIVYVVGDKFAGFAKNAGVVTLADFERTLESAVQEIPHGTLFVLGQGLQDHRVTTLQEKIANAGLSNHILFLAPVAERATNWMTHKNRLENIMISSPTKISEHEFRADIILDDLCAEMSDHMTGQHIQGVVLLEAARQMFLAVTSIFFLKPEKRSQYYFALNGFSVDFVDFAFALDMEIRYYIRDKSEDGNGNISFTVEMELYQAGTKTTDVKVSFSAYRDIYMRLVESSKAKEALERAQSNAQKVSGAMATAY